MPAMLPMLSLMPLYHSLYYSTSYMPISCYVPITTPVFHPMPIYKLPFSPYSPMPHSPMPFLCPLLASPYASCYISCAMMPLLCTMILPMPPSMALYASLYPFYNPLSLIPPVMSLMFSLNPPMSPNPSSLIC